MDVVTRTMDESLSVIVTYSDGSSLCIDGELSKVVDLGRPVSELLEEHKVESAACVDPSNCRKGLLKSREDVIALMEQSGGSPTLQWRVICQGTAKFFQFLSLNLSALDGMQSHQRRSTTLMIYEISSKSGKEIDAGYYELHAPSGTLYELLGGKLAIYDLSGTIPRLVTRIGSRSAPVSSFSRLSNNSVLAVGSGIATVYETKYGSVQGSISLAISAGAGQARKRKYEEIDSELGRFSLVDWFSGVRQAIGICGSELMVLQLSDALISNKRRKTHEVTLADVIGKGTVKEARSLFKEKKRTEKWREWTARVDDFVKANDLERLESLVANDKRLGKQRKSHEFEDLDARAGVVYDDAAAYEELWPLPETFDPSDLDRNRVQYLVTRIISLDEAQNGRLKIALRSPKLVEWLALTGFLSAASIQKSFQATGNTLHSETALQPGDIMTAVSEIDDNFQLTNNMLDLPVHWEMEEIIQALRVILQSLNTAPPVEPQLALPAPNILNGDVDLPNGHADSELDVAEIELDHAFNSLTGGPEIKSDALRAIFARLQTFNHLDVTATMRSMMSQEDLFFLIHVLRNELANGGWTSRYIDIGQAEGTEQGMVDKLAGLEESGPSDESIKVIGFLLNCAVDAIGITGWLVGLGGNLGAKDLVESLRAEVSAGYEGCLEANTVKAFLADIHKFAAQREQLLDDSALEMDDDGISVGVLPIGGKAIAPTVKTRNSKGEKKSKMARAQEKSRSVGKYSFDRIRI